MRTQLLSVNCKNPRLSPGIGHLFWQFLPEYKKKNIYVDIICFYPKHILQIMFLFMHLRQIIAATDLLANQKSDRLGAVKYWRWSELLFFWHQSHPDKIGFWSSQWLPGSHVAAFVQLQATSFFRKVQEMIILLCCDMCMIKWIFGQMDTVKFSGTIRRLSVWNVCWLETSYCKSSSL